MLNVSKQNIKKVKIVKDISVESSLKEIALLSNEEVYKRFKTDINGISDNTADKRLHEYGKNLISDNEKKSWISFLLDSFMDPFILVLLALSVFNYLLDVVWATEKSYIGTILILAMAVISAIIRFIQEFNSYKSNTELKDMIHTTCDVRRNNMYTKDVDIEELVPGDVIVLSAGSIIPADVRIVESKDLFVSTSVFTGESVPIEKKTDCETLENKTINEIDNICLMGFNVISGSAVAIVVGTGKDTYLGLVAKSIKQEKVITSFDKGISDVSRTLVKYMIIVCIAVLLINGLIKGDWIEAVMFSLAIAVGITPGMLPMIVNANLAKGATFLAKKKTIVKHLNSIQNLGAIDLLCTDKTGTLTIDKIILQKYLNYKGEEDFNVLNYAFVNSYFSTGVKNLIDKAILEFADLNNISQIKEDFIKIDEIPFDFERRRLSVVVANKSNNHRLVTKGAIEEILGICTHVLDDGTSKKINDKIKKEIMHNADELHKLGMHVIAIATKDEQVNTKTFSVKDETNMTFRGYVAFLDPPKETAKEALSELKKIGVDVKVLTGDSLEVTKCICNQVGLKIEKVINGLEVSKLDDEELSKVVEEVNIFVRLAPLEKQRVVSLLQKNGHIVGYMGDGVNDAPSLRIADVGISVDTAVDIARESSDIILLEKDLLVLKDGIVEGRRIFLNIVKYFKMTLSGNFGNVFSVLVASIFLPFLPMIPIQMLIQNLLYDLSQTAIPWDNVDPELLTKPKKWDVKDLTNFMNKVGVVSSIFDCITFLVLWFILGYNGVNMANHFQTGWFLEGIISQVLIVHFIRTSKVPFVESRPNKFLVLSSLLTVGAALIIPLVPVSNYLGFINPEPIFYLFLPIILFMYFGTIQIVKKGYIKKYNTWL